MAGPSVTARFEPSAEASPSSNMSAPASESVSESTADEGSVGAQSAPSMIVMENAHVRYRIYEQRNTTFKKLAVRGLRPRPYREVHALKGVTLAVQAGEILGVIGTNGSGKSTMLRAMAGLLPVSEGTVYARGLPALLGVGVALRPRLSGRRNIYIGGMALGLSRAVIDEQFDEIVSWAGLEDFIDMPMRAYSSGMKGRLQFAIATASTPDVLLIDEALSVGDRRFKKRSRRRLKEIQERAGAIVIVTHGMREIVNTCTRAIWLDRGTLVMDGEPESVVKAYEEANNEPDDDSGPVEVDPELAD